MFFHSKFCTFCFESLNNTTASASGKQMPPGSCSSGFPTELDNSISEALPVPPFPRAWPACPPVVQKTITHLYWAHKWEALTAARRAGQFSKEVKIKPNSLNGQFHALEASLALLLWVSKASYSRFGFFDYCFFGMSSFRSSRSKFLLLLLPTTNMVIVPLRLHLTVSFFQGHL